MDQRPQFTRAKETRVSIICEATAEKVHVGTIVYESSADAWAFAYSPSFKESIDPVSMPNIPGRTVYPIDPNHPPGVFADLLPGVFVEEKLSRMIPGYRDMHAMDKLQAIGSRVFKGISLDVGGNPALGIDPRPNQLADFDRALARFGMRDFFEHEEIAKFVKDSPDWNNYLHELKKSYSGQQPLFNVLGEDDKPYLLKLYQPSVLNQSRLELVAQKTAAAAGARIPDIQLIRMKQLGAEGLLVERFDTAQAIGNATENGVNGDELAIRNIQLQSMTISALQGTKSLTGLHYNSIARSLEMLSGSPDNPNTPLSVENKKELFRHSLLNHAFNNIDGHGKNMSVVRQDGEWRLSPLYDMGFFAHKEDMPITFYGEPPKFSADILDNEFIQDAWSALNMPEGVEAAYAIRDEVVSAVINDLPKQMINAGIVLGDDLKATPEAKHIARAVGCQSEILGKKFVSSLKVELQNHIARERAKEISNDNSSPAMER